jgi:glycosyltransferase involved in cell wall biosynthesis
MRRFSFLQESIPKYLANPHVTELVIADETGEDYAAITAAFSDPKLRVYKNERRLGSVENKQRVASYATSEFIAIIDSDNFADIDYFEAFKRYLATHVVPRTSVFLPCMSKPEFNHRAYIGHTLNKSTVRQYWPKIETCLNTMNMIIPRAFLAQFNIMSDKPMCDITSGAYDALYFSLYALFNMNATLIVVDGMEYEHRVHAGSWYLETADRSKPVYDAIMKRYIHTGLNRYMK